MESRKHGRMDVHTAHAVKTADARGMVAPDDVVHPSTQRSHTSMRAATTLARQPQVRQHRRTYPADPPPRFVATNATEPASAYLLPATSREGYRRPGKDRNNGPAQMSQAPVIVADAVHQCLPRDVRTRQLSEWPTAPLSSAGTMTENPRAAPEEQANSQPTTASRCNRSRDREPAIQVRASVLAPNTAEMTTAV